MPTTDKATYRVVEWNGSNVKALCDVYGRLFTRYDSSNDVYNGVAWTDEGLDKTFDSIDEHESAFMTLLQTYGHNDAVTAEGVDNVVINLDGTSTEFDFEDGQLVPVSSAWANGSTPTLFKRTLNDGTADVVVVCDADGKLVLSTGEIGYFKIINGGIGSATANQEALITAAGGSVEATTFGDNDGNYSLISLDGYTVVADQDGNITVGAVSEWPEPTPAYGRKLKSGYWYLTDGDGMIVATNEVGADIEVLRVAEADIDSATAWNRADVSTFEIDPFSMIDSWVSEGGRYTGYVLNGSSVLCTPPKDGTIFG